MRVLRDKVVKMCELLGYKTAAKWNKAKMQEKLIEIAGLAADDKVSCDDDEAAQELLDSIKVNKGKVDVVQSEADLAEPEVTEGTGPAPDVKVETTEVAPTAEEAVKKSKPPKEKREKAPKTEVEVDFLGNRKGTSAAQINAVLTKTPQTAVEIAEKAKVDKSRVMTHVPSLIKKGQVVKSDKGYALV